MGERQPTQQKTSPCFGTVRLAVSSGRGASLGSPVRAVVIVAGDVLFDQTAWHRWLLQLLMRMGIHTHFGPFCHVWEGDYLSDVHRGKGEYWASLRRFLQATGLSRGQIEEVIAASIPRRRELEERARPLPGVRATLSRLADMPIKLATVANTHQPHTQLQCRLNRLGLAEYFDDVISSHDVGAVLPEADIYHAIVSKLDLNPEQVAFVAHKPHELHGAMRVGLQAVACCCLDEVKTQYRLNQLSELPETLPLASTRRLAG